jgi:hypothetical protein
MSDLSSKNDRVSLLCKLYARTREIAMTLTLWMYNPPEMNCLMMKSPLKDSTK